MTGGSRGIGRAVVSSLTAGDCEVLGPGRDQLDLADPRSIELFCRGLVRSKYELDGLVLVAGVNDPAPIERMTLEDWNRTISINLTANFDLLRLLRPIIREQTGRIVIVSSVYGSLAREGRSAYSASKSGVEALVRSAALEFAGAGLLVNAVAPGFIETSLTYKNNSKDDIDRIVSSVPLRKLGQPEHVANLVNFLMDPIRNCFITGQVITIDGGFSIA